MKKLLIPLTALLLASCANIPIPEPQPDPDPPVVIPPLPTGDTIGVPYTQEQLEQGRPVPIPWQDWMYPPEVSGKALYVCTTGDDANEGTQEAPKASVSAAFANWRNMQGGDAILFCKDGFWEEPNHIKLGANGCSKDNQCLIGSYGSGSDAWIRIPKGFEFEGGATNPVDGIYWKDLYIEGFGEGASGDAWRIWDNVADMVWNNVRTEWFGLAYNVSPGRIEDGFVNSNFAILHSIQKHNRKNGGIYSAVSDIFIDYNYAEDNGSGGGARNYYLAGMPSVETRNVTLQRSISRANSLTADGVCGNSPHFTAHGRIYGLNIIDNDFQEPFNTSGNGCWGYAIDEGRLAEWGVEGFYDVVVTGNIGMNLGNTVMSITNSPDILIGWNHLQGDYSERRGGHVLAIPGKASFDPANPTVRPKIIYNKIVLKGFYPGSAINNKSIGIDIGGAVTGEIIEHNEIIKTIPEQRCIVVHGVTLEGDALGTNTCTVAE